MIDKSLLEVLVCPKCRRDVVLNREKNAILCNDCGLLYRIENNIPIMIIDKADKIEKSS